jgi:3-oxoacyl-(acyl-carrier-protein) synthase
VDKEVVITGLGMITPLGDTPRQILAAMEQGRTAAAEPTAFPARGFGGAKCAAIAGAPLETLVPDSKMTRFMNRDALLAVIAARRAVRDAGLEIGRHYAPEEAGIFGATGLAGVALEEVSRLVANAAGADGRLDLRRFGAVALRQVRPVLSFKILSNMPVSFVSMSEQFLGANAVLTPWEGQGAQAIALGMQAVAHGDAACVLAGGCDVKVHLLGILALEQQGVLDSWRRRGKGTVPGEGACFILLEERTRAEARGARIYARLAESVLGTVTREADRARTLGKMLDRLASGSYDGIVAGGDGDEELAAAEQVALAPRMPPGKAALYPKKHLGNSFAAAAATQVALGAALAHTGRENGNVLTTCFGYGSQQGAFVLEAPR